MTQSITRPLPAPIAQPILISSKGSYEFDAADARALANIKAGEQFLVGGQHFLATKDATMSVSGGFIRVSVQSCIKNPAMPSGWALGDCGATVRQPVGEMTNGDLLASIDWLEESFEECARIEQGISTKDTVRHRAFVAEAERRGIYVGKN